MTKSVFAEIASADGISDASARSVNTLLERLTDHISAVNEVTAAYISAAFRHEDENVVFNTARILRKLDSKNVPFPADLICQGVKAAAQKQPSSLSFMLGVTQSQVEKGNFTDPDQVYEVIETAIPHIRTANVFAESHEILIQKIIDAAKEKRIITAEEAEDFSRDAATEIGKYRVESAEREQHAREAADAIGVSDAPLPTH